MSLQEKVDILSLVEEEVKEKFIKDDGIMMFQSFLPRGIGLVTMNGDKHLVATRRFEAGEMIFKNHAQIILKDDMANKKFVLEVDGKYHLLDNEHHFIHRDEYSEMLGFDCFMDHSCSPNTYQNYINREEYVLYARKTIYPGEKVTCDYMALENGALGLKNAGTSSFRCNCGASNCYGMLVC